MCFTAHASGHHCCLSNVQDACQRLRTPHVDVTLSSTSVDSTLLLTNGGEVVLHQHLTYGVGLDVVLKRVVHGSLPHKYGDGLRGVGLVGRFQPHKNIRNRMSYMFFLSRILEFKNYHSNIQAIISFWMHIIRRNADICLSSQRHSNDTALWHPSSYFPMAFPTSSN